MRGAIQMPLILRDGSINVIKWWVDASYSTHGYTKGHSGAKTSLGQG